MKKPLKSTEGIPPSQLIDEAIQEYAGWRGDTLARQAFGFTHGAPGYLWLGACPPPPGTPAKAYSVPLEFARQASGGPAMFNGGYPDEQAVSYCK